MPAKRCKRLTGQRQAEGDGEQDQRQDYLDANDGVVGRWNAGTDDIDELDHAIQG